MWGRGHFFPIDGSGALFHRLSLLATVFLVLSSCNDGKNAETDAEKPFVFTIDLSFAHRVDFHSEGSKLRISFSSSEPKYEFDLNGFSPIDAAVVESGIYVIGKREKIDPATIGSYKYHADELLYCAYLKLACSNIYKREFLSNLTNRGDLVFLLADDYIAAREGIHPVDTDVLIFFQGKLLRKLTELGGVANIMLRDEKILAIGSGIPEMKKPFIAEEYAKEVGIVNIYEIENEHANIIDTDSVFGDNDRSCYDIYVKNEAMICSYIHAASKYFIINYIRNQSVEEILSLSPRFYVRAQKLLYVDVDGVLVIRELNRNQGE